MARYIALPPAKNERIRPCTENRLWLWSHYAPDVHKMENRMTNAASEIFFQVNTKINDQCKKLPIGKDKDVQLLYDVISTAVR